MSASLASSLLAWLLTYLIHSSVLLGVAWLVTRRRRLEPAASDLLWKVALLAGLLTGTIQSRLDLSAPAAVTLPAATLPRTAARGQPAAPATDDPVNPGTPGSRPGSVGPTPSRAPSLPLVVVLLWGAIALGWSLHYVERRFFFQPLNRLARRELETTAEYLSDEWAMRKTGSAVALAKCLATVAEWIQASPLGVPVAGLAERRSLLVSRISRLLEGRLPSSPTSRRGWAVATTLRVAVTIAGAPHVSSPVVPPLHLVAR